MKSNTFSADRAILRRIAAALIAAAISLTPCAVYADPDTSDTSSQVSDVSSDADTSSSDTSDSSDSSDASGEEAGPQDTANGVTAAVIADAKPEFTVNSEAVYMVNTDTESDIKVYAKNENESRAPASLTKIMTAIVVLENMGSLKDVVTVPGYIYDEFYGIGVSNAGIVRGEEITVEDLLYALMLRSACEAASILADYISPDNIQGFVDLMNAKARELGCTGTHFVNAHGLDAEGQYTTAYDMYLITKYAMQNEDFAKISCSPTYTMKVTNKHSEERTIWHTNLMLSSYYGGKSYYEYVSGIKTGTTDDAGRNLVTVGEKDGYHYLLVTLGAPYKDETGVIYSENYSYTDHRNLYEWAFDVFRFTTVIEEYQSLDEVAVRFGEGANHVTVTARQKVIMLLPKTLDVSAILVETKLPEHIDAPVVKGDVVGSAQLLLAGGTIATVDLIAENDVGRSGLAYSLHLIKQFFSNPWVILACVVLAILIGVLIFFVAKERGTRRKERLHRKFGSGKPKLPKKPNTPNTWQ